MILPNSTIMQLTYFDNGLPIKNVRTVKTANGKKKNDPQHMITITGWTGKHIDFFKPDYKVSFILIPHVKFKRRIQNWNISNEYREDLNALYEENEASTDRMRIDRTYYGPLFNNDGGQNYIEGQFMEVCIDQGKVHDAILIHNQTAIQITNWVDYYPNGEKVKGAAKCVARLDLANLAMTCKDGSHWNTQ